MKRFEEVSAKNKKHLENVILPTRGSKHSAGWDFYMPCDAVIEPHCTCMVWTDIKARIASNEVLMIVIRSSVGTKRHLMLANTVGIIDSDYVDNPSNEGNIGVCLYNYGDTPTELKKGERFCQGICVEYHPMDDEDVNERTGGFGSTGVN